MAGQKLATVTHKGVEYSIRANVAGHLEHTHLVIGQEVTAGAVLGHVKPNAPAAK